MPSLFTINSSVISILLSKNVKTTENYSFDAVSGIITIDEPDFKRLIYVIDKSNERILYTPLKSGSRQTGKKNINLNYDTSNLLDTDELLVIYEAYANDESKIICSLEAIEDLLREQLKYLKKIYQ